MQKYPLATSFEDVLRDTVTDQTILVQLTVVNLVEESNPKIRYVQHFHLHKKQGLHPKMVLDVADHTMLSYREQLAKRRGAASALLAHSPIPKARWADWWLIGVVCGILVTIGALGIRGAF